MFTIEYSKNARFTTKSINYLDPKDTEKFKFLMAMKAKELKTNEATYKIK